MSLQNLETRGIKGTIVVIAILRGVYPMHNGTYTFLHVFCGRNSQVLLIENPQFKKETLISFQVLIKKSVSGYCDRWELKYFTLKVGSLKICLLQGTHCDLDHVIPPGCTSPRNRRSGLILPVGSDTIVGDLGCSKWGFLQISFSYILLYCPYKGKLVEFSSLKIRGT